MSEEKETIIQHGRWITKKMFSSKGIINVDRKSVVECSFCETLFKSKWSDLEYCPVCGTRMDETGIAIPDGMNERLVDVYRCSLCSYRFPNSEYFDKTTCPDCGASLKRAEI